MGRTLQAQGQAGEIGLAKGSSRVLGRRGLPSQPTWIYPLRELTIRALNSCEFSADGWLLMCVSSHILFNCTVLVMFAFDRSF